MPPKKKDNVVSLTTLLSLLVSADPHHVTVEIKGQRVMKPDQARQFAMEILYAADEAEGNETLGDFGYASTDSQNLGELRTLLEKELGWEDDEQEVDADYEARIRQVGKILRRRNLQVVPP
jgi:hypothetical protein